MKWGELDKHCTPDLFLPLEVEDGGVARVAYELAEVASTPGKVECVLGDVVSELGQTGVLPALSQSCLALLLWRVGGGSRRIGGEEER